MTDNKDLPLVSARSPSCERSREALRHPSPAGEAEVVALLSQLSEAEENASRTCRSVAAYLTDAKRVKAVLSLADGHDELRASLGQRISALGGSAPTSAECREILGATLDAARYARLPEDAEVVLGTLQKELRAVYTEAKRSPLLSDTQRAELGRMAG
ncbi:MAG: hypothetical protein RL385_5862 [Pseudomonadota bacterium]|jgi:hypothetical protein